MVSAVKVGGRRLHDLARQGIEVDRQARPVTVYRFEVAPDSEREHIYRAEIECSSGTYIRVLAQDLGIALGGGAHVQQLRRTSIGSFDQSEARQLDLIGHDAVLTPAQAMRHLDFVTVEQNIADVIATGLFLDKVPLGASGDGPWAMLDNRGNLLAVYEATDTDRIKPAVVLSAN
jgi:tRNA pseudouridine55 synthase